MCFRAQRGAHVNPFLKSTQGALLWHNQPSPSCCLFQMAKAALLNLSDVHQVQPVCSGSFKKKSYRGFGIISRWQLYNGGTFDSSEQRHRLCLSMDVLSIEKTFPLNCRVTKQKNKTKKKSTQGELDFFFKAFLPSLLKFLEKHAFGRGL